MINSYFKGFKIYTAILIMAVLVSCQEAGKEKQKKIHHFDLTVNLSGDYPSEVYLKTDDMTLTSIVKNSQAHFKDTLSFAKSAQLFIDDSNGSQRFYLALDTLQTVNLMIDKDSIEDQFFHNISTPQVTPIIESSIKSSYAAYQKDDLSFKDFSDDFSNFLKSYPNHQVIGEILTDISQKNKISFEDLKSLKQQANSSHFQRDDAELFERFYKIRKKYKKGEAFYDFELDNLHQKPVKLHDIEAKLIYVEFWSTWSDEPMMKTQEFLDNYRFYKSKSYEVVSISLNTNRGIWLQNVLESNMPWVNLLTEQGYTSQITSEMGIYNLPQNYLVDSQGNIVAKNVNYDNLKTYQNLLLN
ncbi:MAG: TlpA family protein disulfide reductase [Psychroflexus halocasei]